MKRYARDFCICWTRSLPFAWGDANLIPLKEVPFALFCAVLGMLSEKGHALP